MLPLNGKPFKTSLQETNKNEILNGKRSSVNLCTGSSFLDKYFAKESIFQAGAVSSADEATTCTFTDDMFKETDEDSNPGSNLYESVTKETQIKRQLLWDDSVIFNNTANKKLPNDDDDDTNTCKGKELHAVVGNDEKTTFKVDQASSVLSTEKREPVGIPFRPLNVKVQINIDLFQSNACNDVSEVVDTGTGPMDPSLEDVCRKSRYDSHSQRIREIDMNSTLTEKFTRLNSKSSFNHQHDNSHCFQVQNTVYDSSDPSFQSTFKQTNFKRTKTRNHSDSSQDFQDAYTHINNRHHGAEMSYPRVTHAISDDNINRDYFEAKMSDKRQRKCSSEDNILNTKVKSKEEVPDNRQRVNILKKWYLRAKEKQKETYHFVRRLNLRCSCSVPHTRCSCNIISAIAAVGKDSFWIGFINSHVIKQCGLKGKVKSQVDVGAMVDDIVVSDRGDLYISCPRAKCIKIIQVKNPENVCTIFRDFGGLHWYPRGLAVHPIDGTLVACLASECVEHTTTSTTSSTLMKFDTKGRCYNTSLVTKEKCFGYPLRLSIRSDNTIILSDYGFQQITILDGTGLVLATLRELNEIQISPRLALHFNRNNEAVIVQGRKPTITVLKLDGSPFTTENYDVTELLDSTINAVSSGFNDQLLVGTWSGIIHIFKKY